MLCIGVVECLLWISLVICEVLHFHLVDLRNFLCFILPVKLLKIVSFDLLNIVESKICCVCNCSVSLLVVSHWDIACFKFFSLRFFEFRSCMNDF